MHFTIVIQRLLYTVLAVEQKQMCVLPSWQYSPVEKTHIKQTAVYKCVITDYSRFYKGEV